MNKSNKIFLVNATIVTFAVLAFSLLSLTNLGGIGDTDPLLTPLRILNRNVLGLAFAVLLIIIYVWRKDK